MKFGIGQAITRREDDRLLTGQGCFVDDIRRPNALDAMFVRSPYAIDAGRVTIPSEPGWGAEIEPRWLAQATQQQSEI